jgi:hypothetical protein
MHDALCVPACAVVSLNTIAHATVCNIAPPGASLHHCYIQVLMSFLPELAAHKQKEHSSSARTQEELLLLPVPKAPEPRLINSLVRNGAPP